MKASTIYSLKVLAFTIIIPPFVFLSYFGFFGSSLTVLEILEEFIPFILWGGLASLPFVVLFKTAADYIFEKEVDPVQVKFQMNIIGLIVCLIPILVIFLIRDGLLAFKVFGILYGLGITMAVWVFGLNRTRIKTEIRSDILDDDFN